MQSLLVASGNPDFPLPMDYSFMCFSMLRSAGSDVPKRRARAAPPSYLHPGNLCNGQSLMQHGALEYLV